MYIIKREHIFFSRQKSHIFLKFLNSLLCLVSMIQESQLKSNLISQIHRLQTTNFSHLNPFTVGENIAFILLFAIKEGSYIALETSSVVIKTFSALIKEEFSF